MIGKLRGTIDTLGIDWAIIDVQGVGYLVHCSGHTLRRMGAEGDSVVLHIDTHVREDAITLYGFADTDERDWFRLLTTVQGVGSRVALSLLTALSPNQLIQVLAAQDAKALTVADGVGPKLANRIASELKDKAAAMIFGSSPSGQSAGALPAASAQVAQGTTLVAEAVSALVNLGYKRAEAFTVVTAVVARLGSSASLDVLIREGLRELSR